VARTFLPLQLGQVERADADGGTRVGPVAQLEQGVHIDIGLGV
jgi:hypothetical protein